MSEITMDFTTTAMARPEILDRTYASFSKNLSGLNLKECRLFINIDPLPDGVDRNKVVKVAKKYFKEVHANMPPVANFTAACNWVWSNAESKLIFHLEDDWELIRPIPILRLIKFFKNNPLGMEVGLRAYNYRYKTISLSPAIYHERFYKAVAGKLDEKINPETQIRGHNFGIAMPARVFKIPFEGRIQIFPDEVVLKDIGRKWINKTKYKKPDKKKHFTSWERK